MLSFFAVFLSSAHTVSLPRVHDVPLPVLATNIGPYIGKSVRTCGTLQDNDGSSRDPTLFVDGGPDWYDGFLFNVESGSVQLPPSPAEICVTGAVRRRDGLTEDEVRERGLPTEIGSDGLRYPQYVLFACKVEKWRPRRVQQR